MTEAEWTAEAENAARELSRRSCGSSCYAYGIEHFKAGIKWARKNPPPELLASQERERILREACTKMARHWFNKNDPSNPSRGCACQACNMGDAGGPTDTHGHDLDCEIGIAGRALAQADEMKG